MNDHDDALLGQTLVRSRYLVVVPLESGDRLCLHAIEQSRWVVTEDVLALVDSFERPQRVGDWLDSWCAPRGVPRDAALQCVRELTRANILYAGGGEEEEHHYAARLSATLGRDPERVRKEWERRWASAMTERFSFKRPRDLGSFAGGREVRAILIGLCDVQIGMDIFREEARGYGLDLDLVPTFENDVDLLSERPHDFVIVGALAARHGHWYPQDGLGDLSPQRYGRQARALLANIRRRSAAPVLLHNLPVPTCAPLGIADRGEQGLRQRCRRINDDLARLADETDGVWLVDVDTALSFTGKGALLDDRLVTFSHLGGLGWWSQLPRHELSTVHGIPQPVDRLAALGVADPLEFDRILAREQAELMVAILGIGRRKVVVVDLDGTLWPGVLADTGSPFPPDVDYTDWSYHSFYIGVHEALKALQRRGILLAAASKNDEAVVQELWKYPSRAPRDRLVGLDDLVTWRIDWNEKVDNLVSIAAELNLGTDSLVFVDDNPIEREKVRQYLPEVMVLGDEPYLVRWELLTSPFLQVPVVTGEAAERTSMTRAQLARERERASAVDREAFLASLGLSCAVERVTAEEPLDRLAELALRTNQFNTTTRRYTRAELAELVADPNADVFSLRVEDRFTAYGTVGLCVTVGDTVELFALSCRVIGLGVEDALLHCVAAHLGDRHPRLRGRFVPSKRNAPARRLYPDNGFVEESEGEWVRSSPSAGELPAPPAHCRLEATGIPALQPAPELGGS